MDRREEGSFVLGAIIGGAAAAITALLFAPKPGKELRQDIADEVHNLMDTAHDYADIAKEKGNEMVDAAKETTGDIKVTLKDTTGNWKNQITDTAKNLKGDFRKAKSEVDTAVMDADQAAKYDAVSQVNLDESKKDVQALADEAALEAEDIPGIDENA